MSTQRVDAEACSCTTTTMAAPAGEIVVLRVAGEVDLSSVHVLQAALAAAFAQGPRDLVVDLSEVTFSGVRAWDALVRAASTAGELGVRYSVSAPSPQMNRVWLILWPASELPASYPTAAAAVAAAMADQRADAGPQPVSVAGWQRMRGRILQLVLRPPTVVATAGPSLPRPRLPGAAGLEATADRAGSP